LEISKQHGINQNTSHSTTGHSPTGDCWWMLLTLQQHATANIPQHNAQTTGQTPGFPQLSPQHRTNCQCDTRNMDFRPSNKAPGQKKSVCVTVASWAPVVECD
jgi:hypothetical protein